METFEFGPGEGKLAKAFEMLVSHEQFILQLRQRGEVDMILIASLLDELPDPAATLQNWRGRIASYYPEQALTYLGQEQMERSTQELKNRIALWTKALELRAQRAGED